MGGMWEGLAVSALCDITAGNNKFISRTMGVCTRFQEQTQDVVDGGFSPLVSSLSLNIET